MKRTSATMLAAFYLCMVTGSLVCNMDYGSFFLYKLIGTGSFTKSAIALDQSVGDHENEPAAEQVCTYLGSHEVLKPVMGDYGGLNAVFDPPVSSYQTSSLFIVNQRDGRPVLTSYEDPVPRYLRVRTLLI